MTAPQAPVSTLKGLPRRSCKNHPSRAAIGVCVLLGTPICAECSTRYEGVNYSKEGLALLHEQRRAKNARPSGVRFIWATMAALVTPVFLFLMYFSFEATARQLVRLLHPNF